MPAGTSVSGKVVSAKPVGPLHGEAELQLKLTSVKLNNSNVHLSAATHRFGPQIKGKSKVGKFFKGLAKRVEGDERRSRPRRELRLQLHPPKIPANPVTNHPGRCARITHAASLLLIPPGA